VIIGAPGSTSPKYSIVLDGVPFDYTSLSEIRIGMKENHHDVLSVKVAGFPTRMVNKYKGRAISLEVSTGPFYQETFSGYVESVNPTSDVKTGPVNHSPLQTAEIVAMGASCGMKGAQTHVWEGVTLSDLAVELAGKYSMSVDVPRTSLTYERILQSQESDWQFLVRVSNQLGYRVTCHGTHIHIFDPYSSVGRGISRSNLVDFVAATASNGPLQPGTVHKFDVQSNQSHADGVYLDSIVTVLGEGDAAPYDISTSDILEIGKPARFQHRIAHPVDNYEEGLRMLHSENKNHYDHDASVGCSLLLGCRPGGVVYTDGYGNDLAGFWYVSEVDHTIAQGKAVTSLSVHKNINSELDQDTANMQGPSLTNVPDTSYVDGAWRTQKDVYRVY